MRTILDGPVPAIKIQQLFRIGLLWRQARNSIDNFEGITGLIGEPSFTGDPKDLADKREFQIGIEGGGRVKGSGFDSTVSFLRLGDSL